MPVDPSAIATWANLVTVARIMLAPLVFWLIPGGHGGSWIAFALWFVLCASDGIDGFLARRHGSTTLGTFLDPLADKILVLGAMFTLVERGMFWWLPVAIVTARELLISLYRTFIVSRGVSMPASKMAKWKTFAQQSSVGFALLPWTAIDATWLWKALLWIGVVLALISGVQYMMRAHRSHGRAVVA